MTDFMSSEESGSEDGEEVNIVMMPWHSLLVDDLFQSLDGRLMSEKSAKVKRQMLSQRSKFIAYCTQ